MTNEQREKWRENFDAKLWNVPRAAESLGVSPTTVRRMIKAGTMPVVRLGGRTMIRPADLDSMIEGLLQAGDAS